MNIDFIKTVEKVISERLVALKSNNFGQAKKLEQELSGFNVAIMDTDYGTNWVLN